MRLPPESIGERIQDSVITIIAASINDYCYLSRCKEQVCDECKLFMFMDAMLKGAKK